MSKSFRIFPQIVIILFMKRWWLLLAMFGCPQRVPLPLLTAHVVSLRFNMQSKQILTFPNIFTLYFWSLSSSHPTKRSFMAQFGGTWFQFYKSPKKKPESYCHEIACNNIIGLIYFISHPIAMVSILVRLVVNPLIKQINTNNLGLPIVQLHGLMGYINIIIISLRLSWRQRRWW